MENSQIYHIGNLNIQFSGWMPPAKENDWLPLFATSETKPDIELHIRKVEDIAYPTQIIPEWEEPYLRSCRCSTEIHRYYRREKELSGYDYAHLSYAVSTPHIRFLEVCDRGFEIDEKQILACIGSEELFLGFGRTIFHSSCVDMGGQALLFSGVSGIGKSTQADLWEKFGGAKVKNGDRNLIFSKNDTEYACGLPYAGTSGICSNYELPIGAVVFLEQGKQNKIERLPVKKAMKLLLSQFPVPNWNAEAIGRAMDAALRIAMRVPIYHLSCLPDKTAVKLLQETLLREQ